METADEPRPRASTQSMTPSRSADSVSPMKHFVYRHNPLRPAPLSRRRALVVPSLVGEVQPGTAGP
jgi:hypothetical protein